MQENWKSNQQFAAFPKQTHKYWCQNGNKSVAVQSLLLYKRVEKTLLEEQIIPL